jgi:unspecific monooxygenase
MPTRVRSQLESLLVLRRNPLELWGAPAYEEWILSGSFLGRRQLLVNAPDAIRHVLLDNHENYGRNIGTKRVLRPVLGEGLFLAEGAAWRFQRRTIAPALAPRTMPVLARHVIAAAEETVAALRQAAERGRSVDLFTAMRQMALTIAGRSMFSLEMDALGDRLRALLVRYGLNHSAVGPLDLLLPERIPSPADLARRAFRADWLRFMDGVIAAREAAAPANPEAPRDLFDLLLAARDPETGQGLTREQLRDEVATLIIAGHETTAVTLFWACFLAARFPDQQERIAAEAAAADLSPEGAAAALPRLTETRAHIDEALRLYPPAFLIVREAIGPDTLPGGVRIDPGTVVSVAPWVLHRHRRLWRDPDLYDPGRFRPGAPAPDRYAYMPFGAGPRICVGARFALTEAVLALARLLREFRLEILGSGHVVPVGLVTTQPDRPVRFLLEKRRPESRLAA